MFKFVIIFVVWINLVSGGYYNGYKVYEVKPSTKHKANNLMRWAKKPEVDFWSHARSLNESSKVMIPPAGQRVFERYLRRNKYDWKIAIKDVEKFLQNGEKSKKKTKPVRTSGQYYFDDFQRHHTMNNYLNKLARTYPDYVTVKNEGQSYEKRTIKSIRITDGSGSEDKVTMVIDCGIHAREWIAPTFCMYLIKQLTERRSKHMNLLERINWFIVPLLNPDGYEYTHTHERLWRKNRRPDDQNSSCYGVDLNRNFPYEWSEEGTSDDPCSNIFRGRKPFSEPESQLMGKLIEEEIAKNPNRIAYLTFHSYGYYLLYPWGYSETAPEPSFIDKLKKSTNNVIDAVYRYSRHQYKAGNSAKVLYPAAGGSDDFAMSKGIELSLTIELPPEDEFEGFKISSKKIKTVCSETMIVTREFALFLADNY